MKRTSLRTLHFFVLLLALASFQACSHGSSDQASNQVDNKVAQQDNIQSRNDLSKQTQNSIQTAPGLTADQRSQLEAVRSTTQAKVNALSTESLRLRSVLVSDLLAQDYNAAEVSLVKKKIKAAEEKRLTIIFDAVDKVKKILGRQASSEHERMMSDFFEGREDAGGPSR